MECESRFWEKVARGEPDECWEWQAATTNGYGRIQIGGKTAHAHRVAVKLDGRNPGDAMVCHTCDNKLCVTPEHLYVGSRKDNAADMVEAGSSTRKLTEEQAAQIREEYAENTLSQQDMADKYNVSDGTINRIVNEATYSD